MKKEGEMRAIIRGYLFSDGYKNSWRQVFSHQYYNHQQDSSNKFHLQLSIIFFFLPFVREIKHFIYAIVFKFCWVIQLQTRLAIKLKKREIKIWVIIIINTGYWWINFCDERLSNLYCAYFSHSHLVKS